MTRIVATSDLHGHLPIIPPCDLLLLAGDFCPINSDPRDYAFHANWLRTEFASWLNRMPAQEIVAVWGNHDFIGEKKHIVPKLRWHLLQDTSIELFGLKIYGTPYQPRFCDWSFNMDEPELQKKYAMIPNDTDILLVHSPPQGYGDWALPNRFHPSGIHTGSPSLLERIWEVQPGLVIAGHIHESYGIYNIDRSIIANVSLVNTGYEPLNPVRQFEWQKDTVHLIV